MKNLFKIHIIKNFIIAFTLAFILTFTLSTRSGFMMWFILIIAIVLFKSKNSSSS